MTVDHVIFLTVVFLIVGAIYIAVRKELGK